ncbi:MAG TPA: NAD(P)H-hydrate epimerase [Propionibacteriaceae bacterium]|nr:NAD(P)H-hydrate epimerase [Propionibacteriaceae bacterium]
MKAFVADKIRRLEAAVMAVEGGEVLMQRAAAALARVAVRLLIAEQGAVYGAQVLILVGPGNNGGDALYAGARLARRGARVTAMSCLGTPHPAGLSALLAAGGRMIALDDHSVGLVDDQQLVIDGILGIGGRPGLTGPVADLAEDLERAGVSLVAVDLPSGVATDTGAVPGTAIRASHTVTFGEAKPCHLLEPALSRCGEITVVDIGLISDPDIGADLVGMDVDQLAREWPYPDERSDKYARGVVGVDTGSDQYPGAAVMSTLGAVYGGAGMVRFQGADRPAKIIESQLPNVVFGPGRVQAYLFGSGWGDRPDGAEVLARAADEGSPGVIDADGLKYLPERVPAGWLLTPHAGELAKLLGEERDWVTADPIRAVRAGVEHTGGTVLLKGASQLIAGPDDEVIRVALPGPAWTAQAGSGDVLGGVCAALLAAGMSPVAAGQLGASVQALAAAAHPGVIPPQELAPAIGRTIGELQQRQTDR